MSIDIQSPKVTWAALYVIGGLVFSSGIGWSKILNSTETNSKQWNFINKNAANYDSLNKYVSKIDVISSDLPAYERSNSDLKEAMTRLTVVMENEQERRRDEEAERIRDRALMQRVAEDVSTLKVKIGRLEAIANK